jgi:hypothetical protein
MMFTRRFWKALTERAVKTFAESLGAILAGNAVGLLDVDWSGSFSVAGMATLLSVLLSIGSGAVTDGSPSLTNAEYVPEHRAEE